MKYDAFGANYIIEWYHFGRYSSSGTLGDMCFQVVLNFADQTVKINYAAPADGAFSYPGGGTQGSVGIEGSGAIGLVAKPGIAYPYYGVVDGKALELKKYPEYTQFMAELEKQTKDGTQQRYSPLAGAQGTSYYFQGDNPYNAPTSGVSLVFGLEASALPITLAYLNAQITTNGQSVQINWGTVSEINNFGFWVEKSRDSVSNFQILEGSFTQGHGTTNEPQHYSYIDNNISSGVWYYRLKQMDLDGAIHYSECVRLVVVTSVKELAPKEFVLLQNYPNPFNPSTEFKFSVEQSGLATLRIYNVLGQEVATVFNDIAEAGRYYKVKLDGTQLASGMYFFKLESGHKSDIKKMLLLK